MTKQFLIYTACAVMFLSLLFGSFWLGRNGNNFLKGIGGADLKTQEDVETAYEDGYNSALATKAEYTSLIDDYRELILDLTQQISELTPLAEQTPQLLEVVTDLQARIVYFELLISAYDNQGLFEVAFKYDNAFINVRLVENGDCAVAPNNIVPAYLQFDGWSIDGENIVNLSNYPIIENTIFVAMCSLPYTGTRFFNPIMNIPQLTITGVVSNTVTTSVAVNKGLMHRELKLTFEIVVDGVTSVEVITLNPYVAPDANIKLLLSGSTTGSGFYVSTEYYETSDVYQIVFRATVGMYPVFSRLWLMKVEVIG